VLDVELTDIAPVDGLYEMMVAWKRFPLPEFAIITV
jgi:hypothetical protein